MRRLLALRKRWRALGEGRCEFLQPDNHKILSYILRHGQETILVVANLSRFAQPVELDLSAFKQMIPIELFGRMKFPAITDAPYFLTLGPHNFYWFSIESKPQTADSEAVAPATLPPLVVTEDWQEIFTGSSPSNFEAVPPPCPQSQPWFSRQTNTIQPGTSNEIFPF